MKRIAPIIIEDATKDLEITKTRTTIRAIIINQDKVLMVYSPILNDYTFPGGGIKENEDHIKALKRELKEELGALKTYDIIPYGFTEEKRFGVNGSNNVYLQTSYYYLCKINEIGNQSLQKREIEFGVVPHWITPNDAITHNEKLIKTNVYHKGMQTVLPREVAVLKDIKENLL